MQNNFVLDSIKSRLKKPTYGTTVSIAKYSNLDIAVSVVDARKDKSGKTIIWPQAYASRLDGFEKQRQVTIAEALNARVIAVELPGVGISLNAKSSLRQKIELFIFSSFRRAAFDMLGALRETVLFDDDEKIDFVLYSQGAAIGVQMISLLADNPHGLKLKIPKVTIIEPVNDQRWNIFKLKKAIDKENAFTDMYLNENKPYDWLVPPSIRTKDGKKATIRLNRKQNIDMLLSGVAMRKPFTPILTKAMVRDKSDHITGISQAKIIILRFDGSTVSRLESNKVTMLQLVDIMPNGYVGLTEVSYSQSSHHHPAVHSMPNIDIMSRELF